MLTLVVVRVRACCLHLVLEEAAPVRASLHLVDRILENGRIVQ